MENLSKLVKVIGDSLSVVLGIILDHSGFFSALPLIPELSSLSGLKKEDLLLEIKGLDPEQRKQLDKVFQDAVVLKDKSLEAKIEAGELDLERGVDLVYRGVALYNDSATLVSDVKGLVS